MLRSTYPSQHAASYGCPKQGHNQANRFSQKDRVPFYDQAYFGTHESMIIFACMRICHLKIT